MTVTSASLAGLSVGTSGFSYPSWKGGFYPADARPEDFLRAYAERLRTVELNNTFYRLPPREQLERWTEQTPPGFRFAVTMTRSVAARPKEFAWFADHLGAFGDRLGPVRAKVPRARDDEYLDALLRDLAGVRLAIDFRHDSWDEAEVQARLDEAGAVQTGELDAAAPFRYLRFRDPPYDEAGLAALAGEIRPLLAAGTEVFGYFKHEDEPTAPQYAERLVALLQNRERE